MPFRWVNESRETVRSGHQLVWQFVSKLHPEQQGKNYSSSLSSSLLCHQSEFWFDATVSSYFNLTSLILFIFWWKFLSFLFSTQLLPQKSVINSWEVKVSSFLSKLIVLTNFSPMIFFSCFWLNGQDQRQKNYWLVIWTTNFPFSKFLYNTTVGRNFIFSSLLILLSSTSYDLKKRCSNFFSIILLISRLISNRIIFFFGKPHFSLSNSKFN